MSFSVNDLQSSCCTGGKICLDIIFGIRWTPIIKGHKDWFIVTLSCFGSFDLTPYFIFYLNDLLMVTPPPPRHYYLNTYPGQKAALIPARENRLSFHWALAGSNHTENCPGKLSVLSDWALGWTYALTSEWASDPVNGWLCGRWCRDTGRVIATFYHRFLSVLNDSSCLGTWCSVTEENWDWSICSNSFLCLTFRSLSI